MKNEMNFNLEQEINMEELNDIEISNISGGSRNILDSLVLCITPGCRGEL
jgi:hypothetical protein